MRRDQERMLEEGPRVAPEPRMAEGDVSEAEQQAPRLSEAGAPEGDSASQKSVWPRRLVPLAIFAGFLLLNALGAGGHGELLLVALIAASVVISLIGRARR